MKDRFASADSSVAAALQLRINECNQVTFVARLENSSPAALRGSQYQSLNCTLGDKQKITGDQVDGNKVVHLNDVGAQRDDCIAATLRNQK